MTEIQTIEGGQKRCPPKEDQHKKSNKWEKDCSLMRLKPSSNAKFDLFRDMDGLKNLLIGMLTAYKKSQP